MPGQDPPLPPARRVHLPGPLQRPHVQVRVPDGLRGRRAHLRGGLGPGRLAQQEPGVCHQRHLPLCQGEALGAAPVSIRARARPGPPFGGLSPDPLGHFGPSCRCPHSSASTCDAYKTGSVTRYARPCLWAVIWSRRRTVRLARPSGDASELWPPGGRADVHAKEKGQWGSVRIHIFSEQPSLLRRSQLHGVLGSGCGVCGLDSGGVATWLPGQPSHEADRREAPSRSPAVAAPPGGRARGPNVTCAPSGPGQLPPAAQLRAGRL